MSLINFKNENSMTINFHLKKKKMPVKQFDIENRKKKNNSINDIKKKKEKIIFI